MLFSILASGAYVGGNILTKAGAQRDCRYLTCEQVDGQVQRGTPEL